MYPTSDVVVIGGGIIGSAAAFFIANDPDFDGKVTVIEKDNSYQSSSTTLSAASIRQQFSTPENIKISQYGIEFLRNLRENLALSDGSQSDVDLDIGLQEKGYLLLASTAGEGILRNNNKVQKELGAEISLLSPTQLGDRFPWMNCDDLSLGSLENKGEGWFDAYNLIR
ncbi:FAD-dependent oxidoreductase [Kiloniella sp.]|uniref:FAD-dependent oxidoreductase n=1 Tax=Kiloniella sp. TaxID=1938587 RepID=UPI003B0201DF